MHYKNINTAVIIVYLKNSSLKNGQKQVKWV